MARRVEALISGKPGKFSGEAQVLVINNRRKGTAERFTHVRFHCELCDKEDVTPMESVEISAWHFDRHDCKATKNPA